MDKEIELELEKNKADKLLAEKEIITAKLEFIDQLNNGLGEEIKNTCNEVITPIKIKKPLRLRFKRFFERINAVLGN